MKKAVYIYSNFNFLKKNAGVTRMTYYAQSLANNETKVYLMTCSSSSIDEDSLKEIYPNIFVLVNNKITQNFFGTFKFIVNLYTFSKKSGTKNSFIFYPSPLVYLELIGLFYLKFIKKCSVYYEFNEIRKYTATFYDKISFKHPIYSLKKVIYKTVFCVLELFLRYYDGLICISTSIESYGKNFNQSTIRIPILTNPNLEKQLSSNVYSRNNTFNIGFSGSIDPKKENLLNFLEVLGKLNKNNYNFTFNTCGNIEKKKHKLLLEQVSKNLSIEKNIKYYGNLNAKELSTFLNQQQLLVIPRGYTLQNHYGFSTKLSDYLNHGKPILLTDISDNKLFIKDEINGFIVPTDDNDKMFEKLIFIMNNYDLLKEDIENEANKTSKNCFYYKNFSEILHGFLFKTQLHS